MDELLELPHGARAALLAARARRLSFAVRALRGPDGRSVVLLGEAIYCANRRALPITRIFRALRNVILPFGVLFILLTRLLEIERGSVSVRLV